MEEYHQHTPKEGKIRRRKLDRRYAEALRVISSLELSRAIILEEEDEEIVKKEKKMLI